MIEIPKIKDGTKEFVVGVAAADATNQIIEWYEQLQSAYKGEKGGQIEKRTERRRDQAKIGK